MKAQFRGHEVEKTMVVNKFDAVFKLAKDQLQRKIAEFSAKAQEFMKNITTKKHQIQDIEEYLEDSEGKMRTFEPEED